MKNYYELLEVNPRASREIIEKAYKILAKKCHPDLYVGEERIYAEKKLRDLNEAYHVLSDDFLREQYDIELEKEINARNRVEQKQFKNYNNSKKIKNTLENLFILIREMLRGIVVDTEFELLDVVRLQWLCVSAR